MARYNEKTHEEDFRSSDAPEEFGGRKEKRLTFGTEGVCRNTEVRIDLGMVIDYSHQ